MNSMMTNIILPVLGMIIILFSILAFFLPYGEKLKGKTQKVKGFGLDLEVSVLTLFFLIGVIMSLTCLHPQLCNYQKHIEDLTNKIKSCKKELQTAQIANQLLLQDKKMEMKILVTLENVDYEHMPNLENIQSNYFLYGEDEPKSVDVTCGYKPDQFKIILKDIAPKDHIARIVFRDMANKRKWVKENISPFEPLFNFKEE